MCISFFQGVEVLAAVDKALSQFGRIDIVVNGKCKCSRHFVINVCCIFVIHAFAPALDHINDWWKFVNLLLGVLLEINRPIQYRCTAKF